jgi:hypothetical protein
MRVLAAIGVPAVAACAARESKPTDVTVVGVETSKPATDTSSEVHVPIECRVDQVVEQLCGPVPDVGEKTACGTTGKHLVRAQTSRLVEPLAAAEDMRHFRYDEDATRAYRGASEGNEKSCCYVRCKSLQVATSGSEQIEAGFAQAERCIPAPQQGTSVPAKEGSPCPAAVQLAGTMRPLRRESSMQCCYLNAERMPVNIDWEHRQPYRGRPARIDGVAHVAPPGAVSTWLEQGFQDCAASAPADQKMAIAEAWLAEGQMEHASVAAFSKLSLDLMAFAAPPELLLATHAAALDEIDHARMAFAIASGFAGRDLGPAPFERLAGVVPATSIAELARETLVDGCVGETVAAHAAERAAAQCQEPRIARALGKIAEDETRHAELAWRIAAWTLSLDREAVEPQIRELISALEKETSASECCDRALASWGILCGHEEQRIRNEVVHGVVLEALRALVAT